MYWLGLPMYCRIHLQCRRPAFNPWVGKIPWKREKLSTPVFWPREFYGLCSPWGCKESDMTEWLSPHFTSCLGWCKQHCNEYGGACILSNHVFLWIYAQEWGWWVIQELYFSFLKNLRMFSVVEVPIYIPTNAVGGFLFYTASPTFWPFWPVWGGTSLLFWFTFL